MNLIDNEKEYLNRIKNLDNCFTTLYDIVNEIENEGLIDKCERLFVAMEEIMYLSHTMKQNISNKLRLSKKKGC